MTIFMLWRVDARRQGDVFRMTRDVLWDYGEKGFTWVIEHAKTTQTTRVVIPIPAHCGLCCHIDQTRLWHTTRDPRSRSWRSCTARRCSFLVYFFFLLFLFYFSFILASRFLSRGLLHLWMHTNSADAFDFWTTITWKHGGAWRHGLFYML
jgi:hypothetical protein